MTTRIDELPAALDTITKLQDNFQDMDFFFCFKNNKIRTIFNAIRSLPNLYLAIEDERTIVFESTWTVVDSRISINTSGSIIAKATQKGRKTNIACANAFLAIPLVEEVNIFDYGFEILSNSGIDLLAFKSQSLEDSSIGFIRGCVGQLSWAVPPLKMGVDRDVRSYWRYQSSDEFDDYMRKKQRGQIVEQPSSQGRKSFVME